MLLNIKYSIRFPNSVIPVLPDISSYQMGIECALNINKYLPKALNQHGLTSNSEGHNRCDFSNIEQNFDEIDKKQNLSFWAVCA